MSKTSVITGKYKWTLTYKAESIVVIAFGITTHEKYADNDALFEKPSTLIKLLAALE